MADSVGQIGIDLVVNQNQFKQQMSGIQNLAKKAGATLAAAFAVKKLIDFGAQCIKLGSDLAEVQNVVDVTFPHLSAQVDKFAKDAAASFGLSETMAKKFTGTFGAMAKAFGFPEQAAYEMSTALTGLSGDVASFYNISQDEAFTKLKSVFTGETESLKDLGIVMTQSALDQYALANGYGKTTKSMSEAEKVALRYKFVTEQLSGASGDFLRTSDGWANQVRVLQLQFDSLKATIGQGLINILTPVIKVINTIIGKLMSLANAFKALTDLFAGKKSGGNGASVAASGMEDVATSADDAGTAMGGAGGAAKKAAKDIKSSTTGLDELNILSADSDSGDSGGSGGAGGGYAADQFDMGEAEAPINEVDTKYQALIEKAKELRDLFREGFALGAGDLSVFDSIQQSIQGIGISFKNIFTDPSVLKAADNLLSSVALSAGRIAGSYVSVGATIADNLLGGFDRFLKQNSQRIKDYLVSMFDISAEIVDIAGDFAESAAVIFSAFRSDDAKQITADVIGIFADSFMGATELGMQFGADIIDAITAPIIRNRGLIKTTLEDTFSAVSPIFSEIKSIVDEVFTKLKATYDSHIAPMIRSFRDGFTDVATTLLNMYNSNILPVIQGMAAKFTEFRESSVSPLIDKFMEFVAKLADGIRELWDEVLLPFVLWFIETAGPTIQSTIQTIVDVFWVLWEGLNEIIGYLLDALDGVIDFVVGVFTLDWERAWNGVKEFFGGCWNAIVALITTLLSAMWTILKSKLDDIKHTWDAIWTAVKDKFSEIWESIKSTVSDIIEKISNTISATNETIKSNIATALEAIKSKWEEIWGGLKQKTEEIFKGMWDTIKGIINDILSGVETMANGVVKAINKMIEAVNDVASNVPGMGDEMIPSIPEVSLPRLAQGGFVRANTPQLAMIGDNRHYGEIVAPEDKMQEMVNRAVAMASGNNSMSDQYLSVMVDLLKKIIETIENLDLTVNIDIREIKQKLTDLEKRSGYTLRTT